ncbi:hypothetical protein [Pontibacter sp. HJ8]|jgi:hypothetical protein
MENKGNKNPQSNLNQPSAQGSSHSAQSNSSSMGSSGQSSASGSANQSGTSGKGGLNNITSKLQQFGSSTVEKVSNLSTTQKVVGGSLLALGAGWVAMNSRNKNKNAGSNIKSARVKNAGNKNPNRNS